MKGFFTKEETQFASNIDERLRWSSELRDKVIKDYKPYAILVGLTTGFDSNVALKVASLLFNVDKVFTIDTSISAPDTLRNCEYVAKDVYGLDHIIRLPPYDGKEQNEHTYFELVKRHCFPGKTREAHSWMYKYLKDHPLRRITSSIRKRKRNRPIIIISGARKYESVRRFSSSKNITADGNNIWVNIINEWSDSDVYNFSKDNDLEKLRSSVSKKIGISGDCFCGCFAHKDELTELKIASPEIYSKIIDIQNYLFQNTSFNWGWGEERPRKFNFKSNKNMMMCSNCVNKK